MLLELSALQLLRKEEMISRGDDSIHAGPARHAVIRMDLKVAPGVVSEDQVGLVQADGETDLFPERHRPLKLTVVVSQEDELLHTDGLAGGALLFLARLRQRLG